MRVAVYIIGMLCCGLAGVFGVRVSEHPGWAGEFDCMNFGLTLDIVGTMAAVMAGVGVHSRNYGWATFWTLLCLLACANIIAQAISERQ